MYDDTTDLARFNAVRLRPGTIEDHHPAEVPYVERLLAGVRPLLPPSVTLEWYEGLLVSGPGQNDPLFPWLAEAATQEQLVWFLRQEAAGEAGFDDLVSLTQVKMQARVKLEMARNYWDEMGRGEARGMHGRLLQDVLDHFGVAPNLETTRPEPLQLTNVMTAFAVHRRYAYHSAGALGAVEMTAPGRVALVAAGLKRVGVPESARLYFDLHAALDVKHSREWNREVIAPLLAAGYGQAVGEGALLRLWCGLQCFTAYRGVLWNKPNTWGEGAGI